MTTTKKPAKTSKESSGSKTATSSKAKTAETPSAKQKGKSEKAEKDLVTIDRRRENKPVPTERRKKVNRRRQIDPTTCERDYTPDEIEFMSALDEYKRTSGRMFPTCSEVLEVIQKLGYVKLSLPSDALPEFPLHQAPVGSPAPPTQTAAEFFEPLMF